MILQVTITKLSHYDAIMVTLPPDHMAQWKMVERSRKNNIITMCYIHVDLKKKIWSFRVG